MGTDGNIGVSKTYIDNNTVAAGGRMKIWPVIGPSDPTPPGAVEGDIILRRTS